VLTGRVEDKICPLRVETSIDGRGLLKQVGGGGDTSGG